MDFLPDAAALAAFVVAVLILAVGTVLTAGHLPGPGGTAGRPAVWLTVLLLALLLAVALALAVARLPWPSAVIGGGLAVLLGPLVFQGLPPRWRDGRRGLAALALAAVLSNVWALTLLLS